jgi:hypothetical protein
MAAAIVAARALPGELPITLLLTTDEEITKAGAREIAQRSVLAREAAPKGIVVVEPTRMVPMRGHRVHIVFTAVASGIQAHSSTGRGRNANWDLLPFLVEMRALHERLRKDAALQDPDYDPPFSDFNLASTIRLRSTSRCRRQLPTSNSATARGSIRNPWRISSAMRRRAGLALSEARKVAARAPETHPLVRLCSEVWPAPRVVAPGTDARSFRPGALRHHGTRRHRSGACS